MKKFEFKKSYEEINIADVVYKVHTSDEKLKEYQKRFDSFFDKQQEFQAVKVEELAYEEQVKLMDTMKEFIADMVESILGEGTFQPLYEASGNSLLNMTELVEYLADVIGEKLQVNKNAKYQDYVKKVKFGK